jgi:putative sigma-54 modulation protein
MKTIVTGKNVVISEKIQDAIDKKFDKLGRYFTEDTQAKILIHPEKAKIKMEATITTKGAIFRAEDVSQDIFDCIDMVAEKLHSQMSKYKGKLLNRHKTNESIRFEMIPEVPEENHIVVKHKRFELEPMTVEEAALQMELLQHNFFVFLNIETDSVGVVYKRSDGNYGVLDTTY